MISNTILKVKTDETVFDALDKRRILLVKNALMYKHHIFIDSIKTFEEADEIRDGLSMESSITSEGFTQDKIKFYEEDLCSFFYKFDLEDMNIIHILNKWE